MIFFKVKLRFMKNLHLINVSINAKFHRNIFLNEYARKISEIFVRRRRTYVIDNIY